MDAAIEGVVEENERVVGFNGGGAFVFAGGACGRR